jgi:hypothetical protein
VEDIIESNGKPKSIFKYAYLAQKESIKNRMGGKVSYAHIFMILPIIYAQTIMFLQGRNY